MVANRRLAKERGLSQEEVDEIDALHEQIDSLIARRAGLGVFNSSVYNAIEEMEYRLQDLWEFPRDCGYHRYKHEYEFKTQWVGRTFKDKVTGVEKTLELDEIYEGAFIAIGDSAIDLGRLNGYYRMLGALEEVK